MSNENQTLLTKEGQKKLQTELEQLIKVERPKIIKEIQLAREYGDLSENADYDAAKNEQAKIEVRIQEIESILAKVTIIKDEASSSKDHRIRIRSKVQYQDLDDNEIYNVEIVGTIEADPTIGKISNESPIAKAILEKQKGDEVEVRGIEKPYKIRILKVSK